MNSMFRKRLPANGRIPKQFLIILCSLAAVILILAVVLITVAVGSSGKNSQIKGLEAEKKSLSDSADAYRSDSESRIAQLQKDLDETTKKLKQIMEDSGIQEDLLDRAQKLEDELKEATEERDGLKKEKEELDRKLERLTEDVNKLKEETNRLSQDYLPTLFRQSDLYSQLTETLYGLVSESKDGVPAFSIYFEDIDSGYSFAFRADEVWDGEAICGLPLSLAVMKKAAQENSSIQLDTVFTYQSDKYQTDGTGVIQNSADGTEYTHEKLLNLMLSQSDMIAKRVIGDFYGSSQLKALIRENNWSSMNASVNRISARDAASVMKSVYEFSRDNAEYGEQMIQALSDSAYTDLSVKALTDKEVAHLYADGNGIFHEVSLVRGEHPYVISIMTDYDQLSDSQLRTLRHVIELLDALHTSYYTQNKEPV